MDDGHLLMTMAKSKNLHIVKHSFTVQQPTSYSTPYINLGSDAYIDLAVKLSEKFGRNIRQGQSFRLVGYGVTAQPGPTSGDFDMGMAGMCNIEFQEPNKHYVTAWKQMFAIWKAQKRLMGRVGRSVRYDDFELAYDAGGVRPGRTSIIYDDPITIADGDQHDLVLKGDSSESADITSIQAYYNERFPSLAASDTQYGNVIKEAKFDTSAPISADTTQLRCGWAASATMAMVDVLSVNVPYYFGGNSSGGMIWLPSDNHVNIMNGLIKLSLKIWPPDLDPQQTADSVTVSVTLALEGWSPLASKRRKSK